MSASEQEAGTIYISSPALLQNVAGERTDLKDKNTARSISSAVMVKKQHYYLTEVL